MANGNFSFPTVFCESVVEHAEEIWRDWGEMLGESLTN